MNFDNVPDVFRSEYNEMIQRIYSAQIFNSHIDLLQHWSLVPAGVAFQLLDVQKKKSRVDPYRYLMPSFFEKYFPPKLEYQETNFWFCIRYEPNYKSHLRVFDNYKIFWCFNMGSNLSWIASQDMGNIYFDDVLDYVSEETQTRLMYLMDIFRKESRNFESML